MQLRRLRSSIRFITALGLAGLLSILAAATTFADKGPPSWP
jgi:hypothetical protein